MGNRAVVTVSPFKPTNTGVYLHWNGGRASIEAFCTVCRELKFRAPTVDGYGIAHFVSVVVTYFEFSGLSIGVGACKTLDCDNGDNGVYLIGDDWQIVGRKHQPGGEEIDPEKTADIVAHILAKIDASKNCKPLGQNV